jgi:predicted ATPase
VSGDLSPSEVVQRVANLGAKSLLNLESREDTPRYRMLETTRLFGLEKLKTSGEYRQAARPSQTAPMQAEPQALPIGSIVIVPGRASALATRISSSGLKAVATRT